MVFSARTDLAIEAAAMMGRKPDDRIEGVTVENYTNSSVSVTKVCIENEKGAEAIGKPIGNYVTLECEKLRTGDEQALSETRETLTYELGELADLNDDSIVLVVGLGNRFVTPDALGPNVADGVYVTRHLFSEMPDTVGDDLHSVCAIAPGVLGITGIETVEIIRGITERVKPDLVIAIDALASRSINRISTTIQLADTGITPGSGIGNSRRGVNEETLGVKVIAIGVPTVVDAATVANDALELMMNTVNENIGQDTNLAKGLAFLNSDNRYALIQQVLYPYVGNLIVTPKEVDAIIEGVSKTIADSINCALVSKSGNNPDLGGI